MRKLILLFAFCATFASQAAVPDGASRRSNALLRFIAEQTLARNFALGTVINNRCSRYLEGSAKDACKSGVKKMLTLLDYDVVIPDEKWRKANEWTPKSFLFVAFKHQLITLLNAQKTALYLNDLNLQLNKYISGEKSQLNIWEITKAHYKTDYNTALVIAALFQDTSLMKLHIAYLNYVNTQGSASFQSNKELLSRVINTVNLILDSSEDHYRALFYPAEIQRHLNRNIYHFYVPLFLAMSLSQNGVQPEDAYHASLMLTLSYEFITSSGDYRYLYSDPASIKDVHTIKDIFGGYCGSNIGVRRNNYNKSFESVRASFERSTEDGVFLLLNR